MRTISAALLSAGAALPLLAYAATAVPDPTDAGASVPAVIVPSAFDGYKPWHDGDAPSWQQLNRTVAPSRSIAGMKHGQPMSEASGGTNGLEHGTGTK